MFTTQIFQAFTRRSILGSSLGIMATLFVLGCDPDGATALDETMVEEQAAAPAGEVRVATAKSVSNAGGEEPAQLEALRIGDAASDVALTSAPVFQMPFFYKQTWRASTYDGHSPNQNSIDLSNVGSSSLGQVVVASAPGTIADIGPVLSPEGDYYGDYVYVTHSDGWETRYLHIVKSAAIVKGASVVRGQRLGTVGQYLDMGVHLHYTQLKSGVAVRIAFNGTLINVHQGAKKPDGTYPVQDLMSINTPTGITVGMAGGGATATSSAGAGVRAVAICENLTKGIESSIEGPRVAAKATSTAKCPAGWAFTDATYSLD